jgi:hypothetical protein
MPESKDPGVAGCLQAVAGNSLDGLLTDHQPFSPEGTLGSSPARESRERMVGELVPKGRLTPSPPATARDTALAVGFLSSHKPCHPERVRGASRRTPPKIAPFSTLQGISVKAYAADRGRVSRKKARIFRGYPSEMHRKESLLIARGSPRSAFIRVDLRRVLRGFSCTAKSLPLIAGR